MWIDQIDKLCDISEKRSQNSDSLFTGFIMGLKNIKAHAAKYHIYIYIVF